jgi:DNA invertase Pin-like site-specific DNA recombinase
MASGTFVTYLRVSTAQQGASGLGIEGQRRSIGDFLNGGNWTVIREFVEVESGKRDDRPELHKAIRLAVATGSKLLIAKLDRLSRNATFLLSLRDSGVDFVCADMPEANRLTVGILALVAEQERELISQRTKAALQAAKARGVKMGCPNGAAALRREGAYLVGLEKIGQLRQEKALRRAEAVKPFLEEALRQAPTLLGAARVLNAQGVQTPRGGTWTATQVSRAINRLGLEVPRVAA